MILQPGKKLDISALIKAKRFKDKGNKSGAVAACIKLQNKGLGALHELGKRHGTSMVSKNQLMNIPELYGELTEIIICLKNILCHKKNLKKKHL